MFNAYKFEWEKLYPFYTWRSFDKPLNPIAVEEKEEYPVKFGKQKIAKKRVWR